MKEGYKETELGWIPKEWGIKKFSDFASAKKKWSITGGPFGSDLKTSDYTKKGVRIIQLQNIGDGVFIDDYKIFTSKEKADKLISSNIYPGDIILSKMGDPVARACFMPNIDDRYVMASDGIRLSVDENAFDSKFVHDYINSSFFRKRAKDVSTGSTRQRIGLPILKKIPVICPPLLEQKAISNCLSIWDKAIESQAKLIKAKEKRKKALMQQLLTGKKRLPAFSKKWVLQKIKDFSTEVSLKNKNDEDLVVLSCTKHNGLVPSLEYFGRKIYSDNLKTYKIVEKNVFAYATNHIEEGSIGYQSKFVKSLISPMYTVFKTNENINDDFLFKLLKSNTYIQEYQKRMEGSIDRRGGLRWQEFSKIKVSVPSYKEQNAIATILKTAEKEIQIEKQKLANLQNQKKGLMQQLLTGKVRLV